MTKVKPLNRSQMALIGRALWVSVAIIAAMLLGACSDPKATALPANIDQLSQVQSSIDKLNDEEKSLLAGYLIRAKMAGLFGSDSSTEVGGVTIGKAIDTQRRFVVESEARAKLAAIEAEALKLARSKSIELMRAAVSVNIGDKFIHSETTSSGIELDRQIGVNFVFKNNSEKDIAGVKGIVTAKDLFGDEISGFAISNDQTIKSGGVVMWRGSRSVKYALGKNQDEKFVALPSDKFTLHWEPSMIVFADGTKMTTP